MAKRRANGEGSLRRRSDGRWEARYYDEREPDPNKQRKSIIGKTQKEVKDKLKAAIAGMEQPVLVISGNDTVAEWLATWMAEYKRSTLRDTTYESYQMQIRTNIIPHIGHIKLRELTGIQIQKLYTKLQDSYDNGGSELSAATVRKIRNILSGALQQAQTNRLIGNNPLDETKPPKVDDPDIRILSKAEQKQLIDVLPFFHTGNMFAFALATGMRIGEICALEQSNIHSDAKYIDITKTAGRHKDKFTGEVALKVGPPKTRYSVRRIPLLPSVEVMLQRQAQLVSELRQKAGASWEDNTLVFPTDKGRIHDLSGIRSSLGRVLKRAGIEHISIHALRHTYATTALNSGVAAQNVARLLGHKDGATTLKFYAHYINTEALTQLQGLEEHNISHLGITAEELQQVVFRGAEAIEKTSVAQTIDAAIAKSKNQPPRKSVAQVLSVCEDILCQPMDNLSAQEKEILLNVMAQYTAMKRRYQEQDRAEKAKKQRAKEL